MELYGSNTKKGLSFINNIHIIQNYVAKNMSREKGRIKMNEETARLYYRMHKKISALSLIIRVLHFCCSRIFNGVIFTNFDRYSWPTPLIKMTVASTLSFLSLSLFCFDRCYPNHQSLEPMLNLQYNALVRIVRWITKMNIVCNPRFHLKGLI